jgi:hypothetical protein
MRPQLDAIAAQRLGAIERLSQWSTRPARYCGPGRQAMGARTTKDAMTQPPRRFPPPWTAKETEACFIIHNRAQRGAALREKRAVGLPNTSADAIIAGFPSEHRGRVF